MMGILLRALKLQIGLTRIEFLDALLSGTMRKGFKLGLLFPKLRICAALRKKLRMRACCASFPCSRT